MVQCRLSHPSLRPCSILHAPLLALVAAVCALGVAACSTRAPEPPQPQLVTAPPTPTERSPYTTETTALLGALGLTGKTPNLEKLESSSELIALTSPEARALLLSELWFVRGNSLATPSPTGSLAAYLRAAHLSLEALLGEGCSSAFNDLCSALSDRYEAATRATVLTLNRKGWKLPSLATTNYSLSLQGENGPLSIPDWELSIPEGGASGRDTLTRRPGIGLAAAGCRAFAASEASVGICSPLTFVLTFQPGASEGHLNATLSVYDAFERDVVAINGRDLPLAGEFGLAMDLLTTGSRSSKRIQPLTPLSCLSVPNSTTEPVVVVGLGASLSRYHNTMKQLVSDSGIRSRFSFCFYRAEGKGAAAKLTEQLRTIVPLPSSSMTNERVAPTPLALLALDDAGHRLSLQTAKLLTKKRDELRLIGVVAVLDEKAKGKDAERLHRVLTGRAHIPVTTVAHAPPGPDITGQRKAREALRAALLQIPETLPREMTEHESEELDLAVSSVL